MKRRQTNTPKSSSRSLSVIGRLITRSVAYIHKVALLVMWWGGFLYAKVKNAYIHLEKRYPILQRIWARTLLVILVVVIIVSPVYGVIISHIQTQSYLLTTKERSLLSTSTVNTKLIKETTDAITYNRSDEEAPKGKAQALTVAANALDATGAQPYQAKLSKDPGKGIVFSDTNGKRAITLIPQFSSLEAKLSDNRVIYPTGSNEKQIYSFKTNGIKSDIVLKAAPNDNDVTYSWKLEHDKTLEARQNSDGSIGIYSADSLLYDNLQVGDQKSQALIDKARVNSQKTNLLFELPKPFILNADNQTNYSDVSYKLDGDTLSLTARNLHTQAYPINIDPTVTVTSTADFQQNTGDTGNVDSSTSGQIARALPGAGVTRKTGSNAGSFTTGRTYHSSVVYNGYLYIIGGNVGGVSQNDIQYCPINANGSVGACTQQTNAFTTPRYVHTSVVYNGYLYIIGGSASGINQNDIQYCPINANGSVGACTQQTNAFTGIRNGHTSVVYNGYLYIIGGYNAGAYYNDIQYCPINANGSVGTCTRQTNAFTTARAYHTSVVYNGYLYVIAGDGGTNQSDVQYCPINANGSVGTCTQQTGLLADARYSHTSVVYNGYLYIIGGNNGTSQNDIQYCPINANGSVGVCTRQTNAFTTARYAHSSVVYNGYLYIIGGNGGSNLNDIQDYAIGEADTAIAETNAFTTARYRFGVAAYDNYMYFLAGSTGSSELSTVIKCVINSDASLGTCSSAGSLVRTTSGMSVTIYHNVIYMSGGYILADDNVVPDITHCVIGSDHNVTCTRQIKIINSGNTDPQLLGSAAYNGYLYLVGGHTDAVSGYLNTIYRCPISDSDGSVSNCTSAGSTLTVARDRLSVSIYKGYIYAIGGANGSGFRNDIEACSINASGSVGACAVKTTFTNARGEHTSVVYGDKLYIMGGWNGTTYYNDVVYCSLGAGGAVSGCTQQTNAFSTARYGHATAFYNGYAYILGGKSSGGYLNDAQYFKLGTSSGGVGAKTQTAFTTARDSHASVAYDGYLYIIGGWNDPTVYGDIQYCPINANGTVGTCNATTSLNIPRYNHTAVVNNGYIYVVDGLDSSGTNLNNYEYCKINSTNHTITSCTSQSGVFASARNNHASISYNGRLYIIGGILYGVYMNDIEYCSYNSNGTLGSCDQQLNVFPSARNNLAAEVYNGYLYIIGGFDGTNYRNDIIHCAINSSDGSVGGCVQQLDGLPVNRRSMTTSVYNGYLYIFGGYKNININGGDEDYNDDMQVCPILPSGDVGSCVVNMGVLVTPMSSQDTVLYNGTAYITGGSTLNNTHYNYIQRITLDRTMPMLARYERVIDTGDGGNTLNSFTINGSAACNYNVSYKTAGSDGVFGAATTLSGVQAGVAQTLAIKNKQYILLVSTMDDASCGFQSTITSIVVDYVFPLPPNAPTLISPGNAATGFSVTPSFQLGVTGDTTGNLKYKIDVCSTSNCSTIVRTIDETASETGWTQIGVVVDKFVVGHNYQPAALNPGTQYWWRASAIDPLNANLWSTYSSIFSFTTAPIPNAPTFSIPTDGATGVNVRPEFQLGVTGDTTGNLKYKIDVCSTSNCSTIVRTIDETASETGWTSIGNVGGTYIMSHTYLPTALGSLTQYWIRAQAINPAGANQWSSYSSISSFITGIANTPGQIIVNQNSKIYSGTTLKTGN